jgi:hypothetical protein
MSDLPGRELNALVAEKVMGWRFVRGGAGLIFFMDPESAHIIVEHHRSGTFSDERGDLDNAPTYSTDIALAMTVWQKLRESGLWCCLDIRSDYSYCWVIKLIPAQNYPSDKNYKHKPKVLIDGIEGGLDTLAYAICLAALKAVRCEAEV